MARRIKAACEACTDGTIAPFPFTMAFQPIVDVDAERVFAYEALVRGPAGESAASVLSAVTPLNRYAFDQSARVRAITLAAQIGVAATNAALSINFMPGAVYSPVACLRLTLDTARTVGFPADRLVFEMTETEEVRDFGHLAAIVAEYRRHGIRLAIDDFGAGFAGLNLLANFPADIIKIDMGLVRGLDRRPVALAIVRTIAELARTLGQKLVAEGVETLEEFAALRACGIELMQGYLFARPAFEALPDVEMPRGTRRRRLASI